MRAVIRRRLARLRRTRRPLVRLWDRDLRYVSTLVDGGREPWGHYWRRLLGLTPGGPLAMYRTTAPAPAGGHITVDI